MRARSSVAEASFESATEQGSVGVSATVDKYLAVYIRSDGNVRAETNTTNRYFADQNICVVNY